MKAIDQIIKDLEERPTNFHCDEHILYDDYTKYQYWIATKIWKPYILKFNIIERYRFRCAINKWKNERVIEISNALKIDRVKNAMQTEKMEGSYSGSTSAYNINSGTLRPNY